MIKTLNIFTDGGARGNPGPSAIGVYIEDEEGKEIARIGKTIGIATNNTAEYKAVIEALSWTVENKEKLSKETIINFHLDSLLVCSQIKGLYKIKNADLRTYLFRIRELEAEIESPLFYTHIPREKNKKADDLVNKALDTGL
ncbi:MAG: ribonuclease HI family protein [Patescibacteria group bacterium]